MEQTTTKILIPSKGICNAVPDIICDDSELQDCLNFTYHDEAMRPIQDTKRIFSIGGELLCVHEISTGEKHYIYFIATEEDKENTLYYYLDKDNTAIEIDTDLGTVSSVKSVGNTLIVNTPDGLYYFLWKNNEYNSLGMSIPKPQFEFQLDSEGFNWSNTTGIENTSDLPVGPTNFISVWHKSEGWFDHYYDENGNSLNYNHGTQQYVIAIDNVEDKDSGYDLFTGLYAEAKNKIHKKNAFINPFTAIVCLRLYDGSYTYITNPVMLFPNLADPLYCPKDDVAEYAVCPNHYLLVKQTTDYSNWEDIVDNVCVFVSREVDLLDTSELVLHTIKYSPTSDNSTETTVGLTNSAFLDEDGGGTYEGKQQIYSPFTKGISNSLFSQINSYATLSNARPSSCEDFLDVHPFALREQKDVLTDLAENSVFFLLCDIGRNPITEFKNCNNYIKTNALLNLESQEALSTLDYYSFCTLYPERMETYNRRLNLFDIKRSFFEGFRYFTDCHRLNADIEPNEHYTFSYSVTIVIDTPEGEKKIVHKYSTEEFYHKNMFFYYPDPRAKKVSISCGSLNILSNAELKPHPGLNGAYYIGTSFITGSEDITSYMKTSEDETLSLPAPETLQNYLIQSDVDNPFTFHATGYLRIGQGRILGIAALTTALNQDAYKVATTIVFTTQGIWAVKINDEGQYISVAPPFSREVCVNANTITMVDNGVFFVSAKGLMLIDDNGCRCVSTQLNGKNPVNSDETAVYGSFIDFAKNCIMAYDYRDSQLWLINNTEITAEDETTTYKYDYHWVYNMKTGTFSRKFDHNHYPRVVTDYPDTLCQDSDNVVYSMLEEPNINDDDNAYSGYFVTRPMKFGASLQMKSIRQIIHMMDEGVNGSIELTMEVSNDCHTWAKVTSLNGRGYKYFRFKYLLDDFSACDTFSASAISYSVSENNKIR